MTLELANRAIYTPDGIARDVFVPVGKFTFLDDFVVVDYESDPRTSYLRKTILKNSSCSNRRSREIEFFLFQGEDSDFKDSIDQSVLTHCDDLFVDPTPEMFTDEQPPDYSFPPRFDVYPDDFLEIEDDVLSFPDNEDKVFNLGILIHEKSVKIITHFAQEKKLAVSFAS
nr:reverse transcriptase domain-containing protein [Tanacetum cinerariifolium]